MTKLFNDVTNLFIQLTNLFNVMIKLLNDVTNPVIKPMMIIKPRAFKNINISDLPVFWKANKKA